MHAHSTHTNARTHMHAHATHANTRTRPHTHAHTRTHARTQLQEGHRELLAQLHVSVTQGRWGARLQGCRPPWARPWSRHRSSESSPLSKAGSPVGDALTGSELQLTQPHTSLSPQAFSRQADRSGGQTQSNPQRHLAANSAEVTVTRDPAWSLSFCGESSVPLVADNGRARVRTTHALPPDGRTFPRPQAATAGRPGRPAGRASLSPCSGASRPLLPRTAGPSPPPCSPLGTVPRCRCSFLRAPPVRLGAVSGNAPESCQSRQGEVRKPRSQTARLTQPWTSIALRRPQEASRRKGPSLPEARHHCRTEGTSALPPWGGMAGGQGRRPSDLEEAGCVQATPSGGLAN